jgi:DtxR family Mn-dependent transcriptional regulator
MNLGVDKETAYQDADKIEHDLSDASFEMIKKHYLEHKND